MNLLPTHLALRLEKIFSKEEMTELTRVFQQKKRKTCLRVNTLLSSLTEIQTSLKTANIDFETLAFPRDSLLLGAEFDESHLWKLDIYTSGKIYIQGISSQIPVSYFSRPVSKEIGFEKLRILDACAAPGGKTSQLVVLYPQAEIWAFEAQKIRYEKMMYNLHKLGIKIKSLTHNSLLSSLPKDGEEVQVNCIHDEIQNIGKYVTEEAYFDMILVDAPCSGEGSISIHHIKFLENWDILHIRKNYARQKSICDSVLPYLKVGGEMIYSTCTIAPEENEAVVHYLLCKYPELSLKNIDLLENKDIKTKKALKQFEKYIFKKEVSQMCQRVIPSEFSEGFFIAKLKKG